MQQFEADQPALQTVPDSITLQPDMGNQEGSAVHIHPQTAALKGWMNGFQEWPQVLPDVFMLLHFRAR